MRRLRLDVILAAVSAVLMIAALPLMDARAQSSPAPTAPIPVLITTGNTYQVMQAAGTSRRSLTIQNNMTGSDNCFLLIGGPWQAGDTTATTRSVNGATMTAAQASIVLNPGGSYTRYAPYVPSDQLLVTCATTGDSMYADIQ